MEHGGKTPAPRANPGAAPVPPTPTASTGQSIPSPPLLLPVPATPSTGVQLARQCDQSPPRCFLFQHTRVHDHSHPNFLGYVNPLDLHRCRLAWKRQNPPEQGYTPSRATTPVPARSGATQIGSKRAFPIKLKNGFTSSTVQTDLRRPRSISVHAQLNPIFMSMGGPQAHA